MRLQFEDEVKCSEQIARISTRHWLWEPSIASFPGACLGDREVGNRHGSISVAGCRMSPQVGGETGSRIDKRCAIEDKFLLNFVLEVYETHLAQGRHFLHEHFEDAPGDRRE